MTQQIAPATTPPRRLRKRSLISGVLLLILGFVCFYLASRQDWDYVTTRNDNVSLAFSGSSFYDPRWGGGNSYDVCGFYMQPNDVVSVGYPKSTQINGTMMIVLTETPPGASRTILTVSPNTDLYFVNYLSYPDLYVTVELVTQSEQNVTVSVTTAVHHYERPQWAYFGLGVLSSSLAMISIFRSKR